MIINSRPLAVTFIGASAILFIMLYLYRGTSSYAFLLGGCCYYSALGVLVGRRWPVNAWQVALTGSIPAWVLTGWRTYTTRDPYNVELNLYFFIWIPLVALLSLYVGTYTSRWLAIRRRKKNAPGE